MVLWTKVQTAANVKATDCTFNFCLDIIPDADLLCEDITFLETITDSLIAGVKTGAIEIADEVDKALNNVEEYLDNILTEIDKQINIIVAQVAADVKQYI